MKYIVKSVVAAGAGVALCMGAFEVGRHNFLPSGQVSPEALACARAAHLGATALSASELVPECNPFENDFARKETHVKIVEHGSSSTRYSVISYDLPTYDQFYGHQKEDAAARRLHEQRSHEAELTVLAGIASMVGFSLVRNPM